MKHQDYIYIDEDYYKNPKEIFVFLKKLISNDFVEPSILDLGCARGEFLFFIKNSLKTKGLTGVDYSLNLIEEGKSFSGLKNVDLIVDSAEEFQMDKTFDVITMLGVLSYFQSTMPTLSKIKKHLAINGKAYILGMFNDFDVDVHIKYRNNKYFDQFESGWNLHSLSTIKKNLDNLNMRLINVHTFNLSFDLSPQDDPCRAWHINTENGKKFTNGLGLIYDLRVLEIEINQQKKHDKNNCKT
jgi:SAM-dependent methyltransferase